MSDSRRPFADQLLAADAPSADARERHQKEIRTMLDLTLTPRERGAYLLGAVVLLAMAAFFGVTIAAAHGDTNEVIPYIMAYFGATAVACALAAAPMFRGFWTGAVRRPGAGVWTAGVGVAYVGLVGWLLMLMARVVPEPLRDDTRVFGLVLLVYAAVAWTRHRIAQAELRTAEKLLEIELRLAELAEAKDGRPPAPPPASVP